MIHKENDYFRLLFLKVVLQAVKSRDIFNFPHTASA